MLRKFGTFLPKNAFLLKSTKAFMKTLIDDLRKEAEKMRKKLKQLGSQKRHTFIGRFERVGYIIERERVFYEASCRPIDPYYVDQYQIWLASHVMKTDQNYDLVARKSLTSHLKSAEPH